MKSVSAPAAPLPIVFAADANFSVPLALAVESLLASAKPGIRYAVHVMDDGVLDIVKRPLEKLCSSFASSITFHPVEEMVKGMPTTHYFHRVTYARFLIARLLKGYGYARVFYSDADVLFCDDISDVFGMDMHGCSLACTQALAGLCEMVNAPDPYLPKWAENFSINLSEPGGAYFNAGNFLLDCKLFEERMYAEKAIRMSCRITRETAPYLDQDVLNAVCWRDIALLPLKCCVIPIDEKYYACEDYDSMYRGQCLYSMAELRSALSSPAVVHFAGEKPRVLEGPRHVHEDKFIAFWKTSAWRDYMPYAPRIGSMAPSRFAKANIPISAQAGTLWREYFKYAAAALLYPGSKRRHYARQRDGLRRILKQLQRPGAPG